MSGLLNYFVAIWHHKLHLFNDDNNPFCHIMPCIDQYDHDTHFFKPKSLRKCASPDPRPCPHGKDPHIFGEKIVRRKKGGSFCHALSLHGTAFARTEWPHAKPLRKVVSHLPADPELTTVTRYFSMAFSTSSSTFISNAQRDADSISCFFS